MQPQANKTPVSEATTCEATAEHLPVVRPRVDLFVGDEELRLLAELPGVSAGDLAIHVEDNILRIEAVGHFGDSRGEGASTSRSPVRYQRAFTLRSDVDSDSIRAGLRQGLLELRVPRAQSAPRRSIPIEA